MKISVFTPCRNAADRIGETVESVLRQTAVLSGRVDLDYVVLDGASTDGTAKNAAALGARVVSEPDRGLYDAVAKGLEGASGEIVAYLNAGDVFHPTALDVVAQIFAAENVQWLTGFRVGINERSEVTDVRPQRPFRREFFETGLYGGILPGVQQESTFWRRGLHETVDFAKLRSFRLAGDFYLWQCFARTAQVSTVDAFLGAHRIHAGQLSEDRVAYRAEVGSICRSPTFAEKLTARVEAGRAGFFSRMIERVCGLPRMRGDAWYFDHREQRWRVFQ